MNILHMNTSDTGGAARAMIRLSQRLQQQGHTSHIIVGQPPVRGRGLGIEELNDQARPFRSLFDTILDPIALSLELRLGLNRWTYRNSWHLPQISLFRQADVINLNNIHGGYFNYRALPALAHHKPIVWTLHDMWPLTGHCAYSYGCERWKRGCNHCPLLIEPGRQIVEPAPVLVDRTDATWHSKRDAYRAATLNIITPSRWLQGLAQESILANSASIHHVPYGLDLDIFSPADRGFARQTLDLPVDAHIIFFSSVGGADGTSMNARKGFAELVQSLERLPDSQSILLLTSGGLANLDQYTRRFKIQQLGFLNDERQQRLAIASADLVAFPSLADNLPLVLIEALACGVPSVAFDVGGVSELVFHMETGYLAGYKDIQDFAHGIQTLLQDKELNNRMRHHCRAIAESEFSIDLQVQRYLGIYEEAIERNQTLSKIK